MAMKTIDFRTDLPKIRAFFDKRVRQQVRAGGEIAGIVLGMKLCQQGLLVLHFDTNEEHERDDQWMDEMDGKSLNLRQWSNAYMQAGDHGIEFVMPSGKTKKVAAEAGDQAVVSVIGKVMLSILRDAKARDVFKPLPLIQDCQVEFREFDWMWEWPENEDDLGEKNLYRKLKAERLPGYPAAAADQPRS